MDGERRGRKKLPDILHGKKFTVYFSGRLAHQVEYAAAVAGMPGGQWIREQIRRILEEETEG